MEILLDRVYFKRKKGKIRTKEKSLYHKGTICATVASPAVDELKSQVTGRSTQLTSLFSFSVSGRHSRQEDRTCYLNSPQSRQHNCKKTGMFLCLSLYSQYDLNCISLFLFTSAFTRLTQAFISMHLNCCLGFSTNFPAL